jgi:hypothetical protein
MNRKIVAFVVLILGLIAGCGKVDTPTSSDKQGNPVIADVPILPAEYPYAILPDPPGAETSGEIELTADQWNKIFSSVPDFNRPDKGKLEKFNLAWGLTQPYYDLNWRLYYHVVRECYTYVGIECKPYASQVVSQETGKWLPPTENTTCTSCGYKWTSKPSVCIPFYGPLDLALPGQIIQMWWGGDNNPHTAFFMGRSNGGFYFGHSNIKGDLRVTGDWYSFDFFYAKTGRHYTIYQIVP